jgi:hypothetical protein
MMQSADKNDHMRLTFNSSGANSQWMNSTGDDRKYTARTEEKRKMKKAAAKQISLLRSR